MSHTLAVVVMSRNEVGLSQRLLFGEKLQRLSAALEKVLSYFCSSSETGSE